MNSITEQSDAAPNVLFCPGCNERLATVDGECTRCGVILPDIMGDQLQETLLIHDWQGNGTYYKDPSEEFDDLLGSALSVYELESLIGSGGMGRVYLAKHRDLDRYCALKILSPKSAEIDQDYVERFVNEGRATASLIHPNVVTIHAIGQENVPRAGARPGVCQTRASDRSLPSDLESPT